MMSNCEVGRQFPSDEELAALIQNDDGCAFALLSERYMTVVQSRAGRYANIVGVDIEDFTQEGLLALFRAARSYHSTGGAAFGTYATACINNSMADAIRAHMKAIRQSSSLRIDSLDEQRLQELLAQHLRTESVEDIWMEKQNSVLRAEQMETLLSDFEQQVLKLYLRGHTYYQISQILSTATKAVDNALQRVRRKLRPEF